ncbi:MAG: type II toxin-antitoxin system Phd/YefM family antitoxin [Propionibacteriaceae bacterium]|jgi:prevent-host-death family protein|nr:type II toxin-antitoxin system Phd/YefM family antitoxin [Propionibacteriaceae bacterium]
MSITMSSREFNQHTHRAKQAASAGPVIVLDRGRPAHVLLSFAEYERLRAPRLSAAQVFSGRAELADVDLPLTRSPEPTRAADFS